MLGFGGRAGTMGDRGPLPLARYLCSAYTAMYLHEVGKGGVGLV